MAGIDWDNLGFNLNPSPQMMLSKCLNGEEWKEAELVPYGNISLSPAACILNYGQGIFEGLKAQRTREGKIVLFRPDENAKRMDSGAERLCMPAFPESHFLKAIMDVVKANHEFVPPFSKGSLYIRPCLWGTGATLGVSPANETTFIAYTSPVGPYFKAGFKPIKLEITRDFHRSAPKGIGSTKYVGNYAIGMLPAKRTKAKGYSECIYLDSSEEKYIEEVGAANFFSVKGSVLSTPKIRSVLPGITRKSVMKIAEDKLGMSVVEKNITAEEALEADEVFCAGTAAVISSIGSIKDGEKEKVYGNFNVGPITQKIYDLLTGIQTREIEDPYGWVVEVDL